MGDIANAIINGDMDEQTGEWLGNGQGFPRTIHGKKSRGKFKISSALYGIKNYLRKRGVADWQNTIQEYNKAFIGLNPHNLTNERVAEEIQKNFPAFTKYVNEVLLKK